MSIECPMMDGFVLLASLRKNHQQRKSFLLGLGRFKEPTVNTTTKKDRLKASQFFKPREISLGPLLVDAAAAGMPGFEELRLGGGTTAGL